MRAPRGSTPGALDEFLGFLGGFAGDLSWVTDVGDPRVDEFRDLKEVSLRAASAGEEEQSENAIIVEGPETIRMLLSSDFEVSKLLLKPSLFAGLRGNLEARAARRREGMAAVLLCEAALMERVSGIPARHASAALAAAVRPQRALPCPISADDHFGAAIAPRLRDLSAPLRLLALDGSLDAEAVGALLRDAAAFGVHAVLLARGCGDPFHRRAVRVSMGHAFHVPLLRGNLCSLLQELHEQREVLTVATLTSEKAGKLKTASGGLRCCFLDELDGMPQRWVCVVGPGGPATEEVAAICKLGVAVRTALPECPLGIGVVASILLNGLAEREAR